MTNQKEMVNSCALTSVLQNHTLQEGVNQQNKDC